MHDKKHSKILRYNPETHLLEKNPLSGINEEIKGIRIRDEDTEEKAINSKMTKYEKISVLIAILSIIIAITSASFMWVEIRKNTQINMPIFNIVTTSEWTKQGIYDVYKIVNNGGDIKEVNFKPTNYVVFNVDIGDSNIFTYSVIIDDFYPNQNVPYEPQTKSIEFKRFIKPANDFIFDIQLKTSLNEDFYNYSVMVNDIVFTPRYLDYEMLNIFYIEYKDYENKKHSELYIEKNGILRSIKEDELNTLSYSGTNDLYFQRPNDYDPNKLVNTIVQELDEFRKHH